MSNIIIYYKDDYVKKDGTSSIFLQLHLNNKKVIVNTGISVSAEFFDIENKAVKKTHPYAGDYNLIINKAKSKANDILIRYRLMGRDLSPDIFKKEYKNPCNAIDFYGWMENEIKEASGILEPSTISQRRCILRKLKSYKREATFSDINLEFIDGFEKWLKTTKKNKIGTIYKNLRLLSIYVNIAIKKELIHKSPFEHKRLKKGIPDHIYLDKKELIKLIDLYVNQRMRFNYHKTLHYFLFACMTGLRISDVKRLKKEMIYNDVLIMEPKKTKNTTGRIIKVPLTFFAKRLIKDAGQYKITGNIFDTYSDQKTNQYLKDIAKYAGIEKSLTSRIARHTFASLFLEETDDLATLQQLLGHSSIMQTMIYAHVSEKKKQDQIKKFENYLSRN